MIKVILTTPESRMTGLFNMHIPLREVFIQFRTDPAWKRVCANGRRLDEEDMDSPLLEYSKDDEVLISVTPGQAEEFAEIPEDDITLTGAEAQAYIALARAKDALDEAMRSILAHGAPVDDEEGPF